MHRFASNGLFMLIPTLCVLIVDCVPSEMQFSIKTKFSAVIIFNRANWVNIFRSAASSFFFLFRFDYARMTQSQYCLNAYGRLLCKGISSHISFVRRLINAEIAFICHIASILHYYTLYTQTHINRSLPMN